MKKIAISAAVLFSLLVIGTSCKAKHSCPAYGQAPVAKQVKHV
ncbi:MAG: hypothetical protein ACXVPN_13105 [Bacteroidia bacterium]